MGVQSEMAGGEVPMVLHAKNLQLAITNSLVSSIGNTVLTIPSVTSNSAYGSRSPKLTLGPMGLSQCPSIGSYAQLSVLQWSTNPYSNSKTMKSPLMRFSAETRNAASATTTITALGQSNTYRPSSVPAYTLSFQFSSPQIFNFSAALNFNETGRRNSNYTIPECTQYDGTQYLPCNGCNVTSYTNYNVTYSCYDITQICPSLAKKRSLRDSDSDSDSDSDTGIYDRNLDSYTFPQSGNSTNNPNPSAVAIATYGTLVRSVVAELSSVLSRNPFTKDLKQSTTVLIFVGSLSGFILIMLLALLKRDNEEKLHKTYVKTESDMNAKKLLDDDIKKGTKGDNGVLYQGHLSKFKQELKRNNCIISRCQRTAMSGYNFGLMELFVKKSADKNTVYPSFVHDNDNRTHDMDVDSDTDTVDDYADDQNTCSTEASITEFLHRLFPGHAIFTRKTNALVIIASNHDYFKMFGGSTMTRTRTIRFLGLVKLVLVTLFVYTLFFGVFYPTDVCDLNTDKVRMCALNPYVTVCHTTFHHLHVALLHFTSSAIMTASVYIFQILPVHKYFSFRFVFSTNCSPLT